MNFSSELNQSCEGLRLFGQQELSDNADLGLYATLFLDIQHRTASIFPIILTGLITYIIIKFKHLHQTTFFLALYK